MKPNESAVLMCHAPIVIPEIAGDRANEVDHTTDAMAKAAEFLTQNKPDTLIVLSPHTPRDELSFGTLSETFIRGDFAKFGFPEIKIDFQNDLTLISELHQKSKTKKLPLRSLPDGLPLDHGAAVPLFFIQETRWDGEVIVISFPYAPSHSQCQLLGEVISEVSAQSKKQIGLLASGDMSHRLIPGAPAGFHPKAKSFDQYIVDQVKSGDYLAATKVDPTLREIAAEDVIDSLEIAGSAIGFDSQGHRFLSYEGPFGVGYLVSILKDGTL